MEVACVLCNSTSTPAEQAAAVARLNADKCAALAHVLDHHTAMPPHDPTTVRRSMLTCISHPDVDVCTGSDLLVAAVRSPLYKCVWRKLLANPRYVLSDVHAAMQAAVVAGNRLAVDDLIASGRLSPFGDVFAPGTQAFNPFACHLITAVLAEDDRMVPILIKACTATVATVAINWPETVASVTTPLGYPVPTPEQWALVKGVALDLAVTLRSFKTVDELVPRFSTIKSVCAWHRCDVDQARLAAYVMQLAVEPIHAHLVVRLIKTGTLVLTKELAWAIVARVPNDVLPDVRRVLARVPALSIAFCQLYPGISGVGHRLPVPTLSSSSSSSGSESSGDYYDEDDDDDDDDTAPTTAVRTSASATSSSSSSSCSVCDAEDGDNTTDTTASPSKRHRAQ